MALRFADGKEDGHGTLLGYAFLPIKDKPAQALWAAVLKQAGQARAA